LVHELILLTDIPSIVKEAFVKHGLSKTQTKVLGKLKLNELSAREIQAFAEEL